ncbi:MAG TPA: 3-isopropylmalate dehydratase small subunit [Trueperaceae bacterium]|nr:3-isopropylmalate dehydratase small subunit [Trueperaceae bacterium]
MALEKIKKITGKGIFVSGNDVDTDRIIPARYLKCVTFDGLGEFLFQDVRFDQSGNKTDHVLNSENYKDANIMIVESNFGCGSSREHAPQSIKRAGFDAIIGESFAEIFYGNSLTLGMPCLEASKEQIQEIAAAVEADPNTKIQIDIEKESVSVNGKIYELSLKASAKDALVNGMWDAIAELMANADNVDKTAAQLPYIH